MEIRFTAVAKKYLKFWFWVDMISIFPMEILFNTENLTSDGLSALSHIPKILKISRTANMLRIMRIGRSKNLTLLGKVTKYFFQKRSILGQIIPCILVMVIISHIGSCIFFIISENTNDLENWLYSQSYDKEPILD